MSKMNQTQRAVKVEEVRLRNLLLEKGVTPETTGWLLLDMKDAAEESAVIASEIRDRFADKFPKTEMKVCDIPDYKSCQFFDAWDDEIFKYSSDPWKTRKIFKIRNLPVKSVEGKKITLCENDFGVDRYCKKIDRKLEKMHKVREAKAYLASPFAKSWLKKMQFTTREDEYGHKFLFLAILCGHEKISQASFQKLCNAISWVTYGDGLHVGMHIGGKVNWTMFYQRPAHVNGHETYFCGVVCEDDFSPEAWDKDHSAFSFKNADEY